MSFPHHTCIKSNRSVDVQRVRVSQDAADLPITLEQAKAWLKMEDISDDDLVIQQIISEAVDWVEEYCGLSIVPQDITAYMLIKNRMELPYGPVTEVTTINDVAPIETTCIFPTTGFVNLTGNGAYTVVYTAGYDVVPPALIGALYGYISYAYEHRGDAFDEESQEFASVCIHKAHPFTRNMTF